MSLPEDLIVLPAPTAAADTPSRPPLAAPSESAFTSAFGALLPPANYVQTPAGSAAYYSIPPSARPASGSPQRVLFIHGIQTPALGMLPLARALHAHHPASHLALLDLYGHGLSSTPYIAHTPQLFHALIDAVLDALTWDTVHIVGFSSGGVTAAGYMAARPARVLSVAFAAPAGFFRRADVEAKYLEQGGDERGAREYIIGLLEGGPLTVPADWRARVGRGEVVAPAVRDWQNRNHPGHLASVVSMFRHGGVFESQGLFAAVARSGIPNVAVLGELDDVVSAEQLVEQGMTRVVIVPGAGHSVVRDNVAEVAGHIDDFWRTLPLS